MVILSSEPNRNLSRPNQLITSASVHSFTSGCANIASFKAFVNFSVIVPSISGINPVSCVSNAVAILSRLNELTLTFKSFICA